MTHDSQLQIYEAIARRIDPRAQNVTHKSLTGGVSAQIEAVRFEVTDPQTKHTGVHEVVIRAHGTHDWKPHQEDITATEYELLSTLFDAGFEVPQPLLLDTTGTLLPRPYFVQQLIRGHTEVETAHLSNALDQMADFLLKLHDLDVAVVGDVTSLPRNEDPIAGALTYMPRDVAHRALRDALSSWKCHAPSSSLLHGDFWPGNIIWQDAELAAVIDWEDASIGTIESDLAGCRSELMVAYGEAAMNHFTARYLARTKQDVSDLPVWELYASYAALSSMADWGLPVDAEAIRRERTTHFATLAAQQLLEQT